MEINTRDFGKIKINSNDIITFENGLIGLENMKRFVLLGNPDVKEWLVWLQSLDDEELALVVMQPKLIRPDYMPKLTKEDKEELEIENDNVLIYSIVVVPQDVNQMTANLKAPLVVNIKNNKAKQIILDDDKYSIRELILANK